MSASDYNDRRIADGLIMPVHLDVLWEWFAAQPGNREEAARQFQAAAHLDVDGYIGPATVAALDSPLPEAPDNELGLPGPLYLPLRGGCWWSGNAFDPRPRNEGGHHGRDGFSGPKTDLGWPDTTDAMAISFAAGKVIGVHWQANGLWVTIDHGNGLISKSGHLNGSGHVKPGQVIAAGTDLAPVWGGITLPHIHFETWIDGRPVDSGALLERLGAGALS